MMPWRKKDAAKTISGSNLFCQRERYAAKKARMASSKNHLKGPRKRTAEDDRRFAESFEKMVRMAMNLPREEE